MHVNALNVTKMWKWQKIRDVLIASSCTRTCTDTQIPKTETSRDIPDKTDWKHINVFLKCVLKQSYSFQRVVFGKIVTLPKNTGTGMCWYLYWRVPEKNGIEASPNKNAPLNMSLCDKHVSIKHIYAHTHTQKHVNVKTHNAVNGFTDMRFCAWWHCVQKCLLFSCHVNEQLLYENVV